MTMRLNGLLVLSLFAIVACQKNVESSVCSDHELSKGVRSSNASNRQDSPSSIDDNLLATFGEQMGHPFSIERVVGAFRSLSNEVRSGARESDICSTHKYVRFMPSSENELWEIKKREDLIIYPYPLDCEITEGIVGINNPFLKNGFPQYWCIVEMNYPLEEIICPFALESELWCPSESHLPDVVVSAICHQLLLDSQGFYADNMNDRGTTSYVPGGSVRYVDSILGMKPISGMEVEAFNTWHNYGAVSNSYGYFSMGGHSFSGDFRYRFKFSRSDFALRDENNTTDLEYVTGYTHAVISRFFTGDNAKYSAVFQAAEFYYYEQTDVPTPPLNGLWSACLRLFVHPNSMYAGEGQMGACSEFSVTNEVLSLWHRPIIDVYGLHRSGEIMGSDELYGATIHELGHAMHFEMNHSLFSSIEYRVKESVASGIEWFFTLPRYPGYDNLDFAVNADTGIIRDLCDGIKPVSCYWLYDNNEFINHYAEYYDEINSSFTISEVIDAVQTCVSPQEWNNRLYTLGHIPGEELHNAFAFWFNYNN